MPVDAPTVTCAPCGRPLSEPGLLLCPACWASRVVTVGDLQPHKQRLLQHLRRAGLHLPAPTFVLIARPGQVFPPEAQRGVGHVGDTHWSWKGRRLHGPITIRVAGGLPGHVFGQVLAHEYGHACVASARPPALPLPVLEGFAECVAATFLASLRDDLLARAQLAAMARRTDAVYGDGYRHVARSVARHGLVAVADALRSGRVAAVGL